MCTVQSSPQRSLHLEQQQTKSKSPVASPQHFHFSQFHFKRNNVRDHDRLITDMVANGTLLIGHDTTGQHRTKQEHSGSKHGRAGRDSTSCDVTRGWLLFPVIADCGDCRLQRPHIPRHEQV